MTRTLREKFNKRVQFIYFPTSRQRLEVGDETDDDEFATITLFEMRGQWEGSVCKNRTSASCLEENSLPCLSWQQRLPSALSLLPLFPRIPKSFMTSVKVYDRIMYRSFFSLRFSISPAISN